MSLRARDFRILVPSYERPSRSRLRGNVQIPLFPGYLFCRAEERSLLPILESAGVVHILSRDGKPEMIRRSEIASLVTLLAQGYRVEPCPVFYPGQPVRVSDGPLAGVEGFVVRDDARTSLVISISLLQRSVATQIDRTFVEAA